MSDLNEFIIKDVRCFHDEQRASIRPLTLLVGENSTGKTSFLGSYRVLHQHMLHKHMTMLSAPDFNSEPFHMGTFKDIVRARRGRPGNINKFVLGCRVESEEYDISLTFTEKGSEPVLSKLCFKFLENSYLNIIFESEEWITFEIPEHTIKARTFFMSHFPLLMFFDLLFTEEYLKHLEVFEIKEEEAEALNKFMQKVVGKKDGSKKSTILTGEVRMFPEIGKEKSIAPLRSEPRRTYDPISESPTPEGAHIPMLMMRLLRNKDKDWDTLHDDLVEFGSQSGLFSEIKIKSHGKQINDPFQLQVKVRKGPQSNIMDVGYGVNQILPILVEVIHSKPTTFLLQQPEVHLHPRGQAELATFLVKSVDKKKHSFLIETHSDYIVDRVRMSVRDKIIKPEDVSILYFEPKSKGGAVVIHNIKVDEQGNLENAPQGYRDFFLKETDKLLGF